MTGISLFELTPVFSALALESCSRLTLVDAAELAQRHAPGFPPDTAALVTGFSQAETAGRVKKSLASVYPFWHVVKFVVSSAEVVEIRLDELDGQVGLALFVPALAAGTSFESFHEIVVHLRAPDGCPWDREQTHLSLRKSLLEETYETLSAMDEVNPAKMREEFGDLLLQIFLNAQIGSEYGGFTLTEVVKGIYDKIVYRHPHVFGDVVVDGAGQVLANWEKLKKEERKQKGEAHKGILDGLPAALPALSQAQGFQYRAAHVGFDWPEIEGVLAKVREEIDEVRAAENEGELADELGDLFFVLVNLARWKKVDAEAALRGANLKFKRRFQYIEQRSRELNKPLQEMSLDEMDGFWNEAKRIEKSGSH
jgi:tetrapyrrole methylase family protein/MazG family protein